jgi:hypothetical protein
MPKRIFSLILLSVLLIEYSCVNSQTSEFKLEDLSKKEPRNY